ncbi:hypothetical protein KGF56_000452 [Candida oxycetoniae]|uniref:Transmembrane protein n=1 Tax=Candida oxycetoniae TaxID=497107 RepID=A0AAI9T0X8_9ASCO|nr:uncharacterized protein KGF56_000452 [Candida oxycetoniae]KAI3406846.2 hypothetical protein KGF56_000452 [Candida oxycetoniae]
MEIDFEIEFSHAFVSNLLILLAYYLTGLFFVYKELARVNGSMGQWVNGSMGQWVNGSMGQWVNGSMANGSMANGSITPSCSQLLL